MSSVLAGRVRLFRLHFPLCAPCSQRFRLSIATESSLQDCAGPPCAVQAMD